MARRLYRSSEHRVIAGICGGLAEYFQTDPIILRIIFLFLIPAGGILIYFIIWIMVPEKNNQHKLADEIDEHMAKSNNHAHALIGFFLMLIGIIFLADNLFPGYDFYRFWPILLILFGLVVMFRHHEHK